MDRRPSPAEAERIIAGDLLAAARRLRLFDEATTQVKAWIKAHPEATDEEIRPALFAIYTRAADRFILSLYGVLVEELPAAVDGVSSPSQ